MDTEHFVVVTTNNKRMKTLNNAVKMRGISQMETWRIIWRKVLLQKLTVAS